jgi:hypothetical protein
MQGIQSVGRFLKNQLVSPKSGDKDAATGTEFDATLKGMLTPDTANKVSEEDLFAALVQERIKKTKGEDALGEFQKLFDSAKTTLRKPDGYVPVEDATKLALTQFRDAGKITAEETDSMYSQAFAGAQLDSNEDVLFDGKGGANDPTIAVATLEEALLASRVKFEKFDAGEVVAKTRSVSEASNGKTPGVAGASSGAPGQGFLFKPTSDTTGNLVVLLPPSLAGQVANVRLVAGDGTLIEEGRSSGNGNGGRDHFRFNKPGASYPDGLTVEAQLTSGEVVRYLIEETSERNENGQSSTASGGSESSSIATAGATQPAKIPSSARPKGPAVSPSNLAL